MTPEIPPLHPETPKTPSAQSSFGRIQNFFSRIAKGSKAPSPQAHGAENYPPIPDTALFSHTATTAPKTGGISASASAEKRSQLKSDLQKSCASLIANLSSAKDPDEFNKTFNEVISLAAELQPLDKDSENTTKSMQTIIGEACHDKLADLMFASAEIGKIKQNIYTGKLENYKNTALITFLSGMSEGVDRSNVDNENIYIQLTSLYSIFTSKYQLSGPLQRLGQGGYNEVFLTPAPPNDKGISQFVFKPTSNALQAVSPLAKTLGIPPDTPRFTERSVAASAIDKMLGWNVIVDTDFATHNGKAGIAMELAEGETASKSRYLEYTTKINVNPRDKVQIEQYIGFIKWDLLTGLAIDPNSSAYINLKQLVQCPPDSKLKLFFTNDPNNPYILGYTVPVFNKFKTNPILQQKTIQLQLEDALTGQGDRHGNNYFIQTDPEGNVIGIKGHDNDTSFGSKPLDLRTFSNTWRNTFHFNGTALPPVIDSDMFNKITNLTEDDITDTLNGKLTTQEIANTHINLAMLKSHCEALKKAKRVIKPSEWGTSKVNSLLNQSKLDAAVVNYCKKDDDEIKQAIQSLGFSESETNKRFINYLALKRDILALDKAQKYLSPEEAAKLNFRWKSIFYADIQVACNTNYFMRDITSVKP